jgi:hypothetical protein
MKVSPLRIHISQGHDLKSAEQLDSAAPAIQTETKVAKAAAIDWFRDSINFD